MRSSDFVHEIEIGVSRESLRTFLGDLHNYVALHPLIVSIDELEPLAERPSARRYRVIDRVRVGPLKIRASYVAELETIDQGLVHGRAWQRPGVRVETEYELTAVDAGTSPPDAGPLTTLAADALPIFLARCAECHSGPSAALDFDADDLHTTLLEATPQIVCFDGLDSLERPYVVAGSAEESLLWIKAADIDFSLECGREMPPLGEGPILSFAPEEAEVIWLWIEQGAAP